MEKIKEFLSDNYEESFLYLKLLNQGLAKESCVILRTMLNKTIKSRFGIKFHSIVEDAFNAHTTAQMVSYLPFFIELYEKKFIQEASGKQFNYKDNAGLILFQSIALTRYAHVFFNLANEFDGARVISDSELEEYKHKPYTDLSVYLNDCFDMIDARIKLEFLTSDLRLDLINTRLKNSPKFHNPFNELMKDYDLSAEETLIIMALLKEELTGSKKPLHYEELLSIINPYQLEKIRNYELLSDDSKLLSNELVEYVGNDNRFIISDNVIKYFFPHKGENIKAIVEELNFFEYLEVQEIDLVLSKDVSDLATSLKKRLTKSVAKRLKDWGIVKDDVLRANIIFYGPPGTGKTMSASYLAKTLKREIITLDCSKVLDKYVGESEKNVRAIFDNYKAISKSVKTPPILLLNEADQFLSTRSVASHGSELMHNQMQNIFLEQLEKFDGILIATTNFLDSLDPAFSRRFEYKIKFSNPNELEREKIWKLHLPKNAEFESGFKIDDLKTYELSGAQIKMIVKNTAIKVAQSDGIFRLDDFKDSIQKELNNDFSKEIKMGFN
ncbi:ATP-binding protein [Campylobacter sp. Cr9]|uniref:AAA family ATPase n=1 Tax=unclassified Campylobacter TaxID=2593542 RepID=UPI001EFB710D|nr:ATP-binding protein [Campylobacter sp. RM5004]MBZ7984951.1 ATP-binding protein [Campylobacter sp. Cr9]ULO02236.1 ATP-binding protein (AAA domain) [Campylobacter sp. RM5004]